MKTLNVVLIDTSSWIETLRENGRDEIREKVTKLTLEGRAAWCEMVRLELWNGVRGERERQILKRIEQDITRLPITPEVWEKSIALSQLCRRIGKTVPSTDILIAACAWHHGVEIEYCDHHFSILQTVRE